MSARIVFDLDGTLIDSAPDIHLGVNGMLAARDLAPLSLDKVTSFIGNGLPHLAKLVMEDVGLPTEDHPSVVSSLLAQYDAVNGQLTRPYPGVPDALAQLRRSGHRIGLCTNKPFLPARAILEKLDLDVFDVIIGGDSLSERKPHPAPLEAALSALGEGPAFYVGDSEVDAETAQRAQVPFLLFTEGYRKSPVEDMPHHARFSEFETLPELLCSLQAGRTGH